MPTINFNSNGYSGEVLEDLLVYTAQGNDTYEAGLIHIKPGIQAKYTLPHMSLGSIIQDNKPTPTSEQGKEGTDGFNKYEIAERYLAPEGLMVYVEFNPRDFEKYWKPFQPDGNLIFRELDPKTQASMLRLLIDKKDQYINDSIWCARKGGVDSTMTVPVDGIKLGGDSPAGKMKYFDGALMRLLKNTSASADANEKATGTAILAGNEELTTGEKVEAALYAMWKSAPVKVRKSKKAKFVLPWGVWDLYDQYITNKDHKYVENPDENRFRFKGKEIKVIDGVPDSTIFFGKFTTDDDSCLWMGVDYATDESSVKVERLQNNSELYFFQMRLKMDVNIVRPGEIVFWTPYKLA